MKHPQSECVCRDVFLIAEILNGRLDARFDYDSFGVDRVFSFQLRCKVNLESGRNISKDLTPYTKLRRTIALRDFSRVGRWHTSTSSSINCHDLAWASCLQFQYQKYQVRGCRQQSQSKEWSFQSSQRKREWRAMVRILRMWKRRRRQSHQEYKKLLHNTHINLAIVAISSFYDVRGK